MTYLSRTVEQFPKINAAALGAVDDSLVVNGVIAYVISIKKLFRLNKASVATANNYSVIATLSGVGRWEILTNTVYEVANESDQLDLPATPGDIAKRTDTNSAYARLSTNLGTIADWTLISNIIDTSDIIITGGSINGTFIGNDEPFPGAFTELRADDDITKTFYLIATNSNVDDLVTGDIVTVAGDDAINSVPIVERFSIPGLQSARGIFLGAILPVDTTGDFLYQGRTTVDLDETILFLPATLYVQATGRLGTTLTATRAGSALALISGTTYAVDIDFDTVSLNGVIQIKIVSTSTYTAMPTDSGKMLIFTYAGNVTVTLPQTSTVTLPSGFNFKVTSQNGSSYGVVFVGEGSDVIDGATRLTNNQSGEITKIVGGSPNTYFVNIAPAGAFLLPSSASTSLTNPLYATYYYNGSVDTTITFPSFTAVNSFLQGRPLTFKNNSDNILTIKDASAVLIAMIPPGFGALITPVDSAFEVTIMTDLVNDYVWAYNQAGRGFAKGEVLTLQGYHTGITGLYPTIKILTSPGVEVAYGVVLVASFPNNSATSAVLRRGTATLDLTTPGYTAGTKLYVNSVGQIVTAATPQYAGVILSTISGSNYRCYIDFDGGVSQYASFIAGVITGLTTLGATTATFTNLNATSPNLGDYATNTLTASLGAVVTGGGNSITSSPKSFVSGAANAIANSDSCAIIGGLNNNILNGATNSAIISGLAATIDNCDNSTVIGGSGTHSLTNADSAIAGGFGSCTVVHGGGFTFSASLGGALSSRTNFQWLTDFDTGYIFLGPNMSITMESVLADGSMDNSTYHFYTTTTGPITKYKDASGNIGRAYLNPMTRTVDSQASIPGSPGTYALTNPISPLYQLGFVNAGGSITLPTANVFNSPLGVRFVIYNTGAFAFAVKDVGGNTLIPALKPGASEELFLQSNATANGVWTGVTLGTLGGQQADNIQATGGALSGVTINSSVIGGITPAAITGTTVTASTLVTTAATSGSAVTDTLSNTSNTANSDAKRLTQVAGTSSGDPFEVVSISGGQAYSKGIDNSVTGDPYKLSASAVLGTTDGFIMTSAGEITLPLQPSFLAYLGSDQLNVTGDGTVYTIICNTEVVDRNSDYNNATGVATSPVTALWLFGVGVGLMGLTSSQTAGNLSLVTSNRTYIVEGGNPANNRDGANIWPFKTCLLADMDAGDTAFMQVVSSNGAKVVDIDGDAGMPVTYFAGFMLG